MQIRGGDVLALTINDILPGNNQELYQQILDEASTQIRVAMPGIVQAFDSIAQTVTVQLAVREKIRQPDLTYKWIEIPLLVDVPVVFPSAGGFSLTLPVAMGDECLVVFADMIIDGWWASGGVQNQPEKRRHDLSDGFAILGIKSQPRKLANYSTTSAQLRTDDGAVFVDVSTSGIKLNGNVTITGTLTTASATIGGIAMTTHIHSDPQGGTTGGPE